MKSYKVFRIVAEINIKLFVVTKIILNISEDIRYRTYFLIKMHLSINNILKTQKSEYIKNGVQMQHNEPD